MSRQDTANALKSVAAFKLTAEMQEMLNDIAASATILGATPFAGGPAAKKLAASLHQALLEFEIELAAIGRHEFEVKK
ncbi:MAG: hypothetical protein ICCCNLDF_02685 [Planctomycetes bacterium]|nr:hypothetical protein [Planctomycetota bacterium]